MKSVCSGVLATAALVWCTGQGALAAEDVPRAPVEIGARVYGRFSAREVRAPSAEPNSAFELARARLSLELRPLPFATTELDLDVAGVPAVKDAFVDVAVRRELHVVAGQLKRPFSRIELTSPGRLPAYRRGLVNERLTRALGFGGRDIGVMLSGEAGPLSYAAGAFNGTKAAEEVDSGKDASARLVLAPIRGLELGASGSLVFRNARGSPVRRYLAGGVDARVKVGRVEVVGEIIGAEEPRREAGRTQAGGGVYVVVSLPRVADVSLRPLVELAVLDEDVSRSNDEARSLLAGVNVHFGRALRLMVQGEAVQREALSSQPRERRVVVQLALDFKTELAGAPREEEP